MKKIAQHSKKGFTLIELLVVIGIMLMLMGLVMAVVPNSDSAVTLSRIANIDMALKTYKEHFQAFPRSYHDEVLDQGYDDPVNVGSRKSGTMSELIHEKNLQRRDLKVINQMYVSDAGSADLSDDGLYFVDGWNNKFVYFSGQEIFEANTDPALAAKVIPTWLKAADAMGHDFTDPSTALGAYNANNYYFLISAGEDGVFTYNVLPGGSSYDPYDYDPKTTPLSSVDNSGPSVKNPDSDEDDDKTNYNMRLK